MILIQRLSDSFSQTMAEAGEIVKSSSFTCLAVYAGCWLGIQLGLSAGILTCDFSMWPGFPHITMTGVEEQVLREREKE